MQMELANKSWDDMVTPPPQAEAVGAFSENSTQGAICSYCSKWGVLDKHNCHDEEHCTVKKIMNLTVLTDLSKNEEDEVIHQWRDQLEYYSYFDYRKMMKRPLTSHKIYSTMKIGIQRRLDYYEHWNREMNRGHWQALDNSLQIVYRIAINHPDVCLRRRLLSMLDYYEEKFKYKINRKWALERKPPRRLKNKKYPLNF